MTVAALPALAGAGSFAALIVLTLLHGRPGREAWTVVVACGLTAAWSLAAFAGGFGRPDLVPLLEVAHSLAWIGFLETLLSGHPAAERAAGWRRATAFVAPGLGVALLLADLRQFALGLAPDALTTTQILGRGGLAILGLLLVENLYRNTATRRLWNVVPLCIALGGVFAYQLFLYSDGLLARAVDPGLVAAQPAVTCVIAPFLALTLARNRDWRIGIAVSRQVVLHGLTLVASGILLLVVAAVGVLLRRFGGEWGHLAQITLLFGSLLVLATVVSSGSVKARLKYLVSRNFFALRYDYRVEWMNFIDILSSRDPQEDLRRRVIRAIATIVDSPGGILWLADTAGGPYLPVSFWNMHSAPGVVAAAGDEFIAGFRGGRWIQELGTGPADAVWLAVPLAFQDRLIGFVTLAPSRARLALSWESFELLRAVARQAVSYIAEERTARDLSDMRHLQDYAKRFTFVAHDIKNLTAQLRMIVVNAQRHGDNPEFRAEAFRTIEHSVSRMNDLLLQLRANRVEDMTTPLIDPVPLIIGLARDRAPARVTIATLFATGGARVRIDSDRLRSSLTHLLDNAIEASAAGGVITMRAARRDTKMVIEIADAGDGMDAEFIHEHLFRPFRSTKSEGHGIGAYQTRDLIRSAGGVLEVISNPGAGTTMRVVLPIETEGAVSSAA